jgi:hypothetical protein
MLNNLKLSMIVKDSVGRYLCNCVEVLIHYTGRYIII